MNGEIDPLGVLFLVAWLIVGGFAVSKFFQQPRRRAWHWVALIIGVVMLAIAALSIVFALIGLLL